MDQAASVQEPPLELDGERTAAGERSLNPGSSRHGLYASTPTDRSRPSFRHGTVQVRLDRRVARAYREQLLVADGGRPSALRRPSRQIAAALQSPFRNLARREAQRDTVHAIARACRLGAIGKDMAEMCIAMTRSGLGPAHEPRAVLVFAYRRPYRPAPKSWASRCQTRTWCSTEKSGAPQQRI